MRRRRRHLLGPHRRWAYQLTADWYQADRRDLPSSFRVPAATPFGSAMPCERAAARVSHSVLTLHHTLMLASRDAAQLPRGAAAVHRVTSSTIGYPAEDAPPTSCSEAVAMIATLKAVLGAPVGVDGFSVRWRVG